MIEVFDINGKKSNVISSGKRTWVDITNPTKEELKKLQDYYSLHRTVIEDLNSTKTRPKIEQFEDYTLIIFNIINKSSNMATRELDIVLGKNFLITTHKDQLLSLKTKQDKERLSEFLKQGCDFLLYNILSNIIDDYFPAIEVLDGELDDLQNKALTNPQPDVLKRLFKIKRSLLKLRKSIYPQREILANLSLIPYINNDSKIYFRDLHDHMIIIADLIEDQREIISSIMEVHLSVTSNKLNEIMK